LISIDMISSPEERAPRFRGTEVAASPQVFKQRGDTPRPGRRYRNGYATAGVRNRVRDGKSARHGHLPEKARAADGCKC
jgi:hypothetical protein